MEKNMKKDFFNHDAYLLLSEKARGEADDLDVIKEAMESFCEYVRVVDDTEVAIRMASFRLEGYDLRQAIENYDKSRRLAHNSAIVNARMINRIAALYAVDAIFTGDYDDRLQVADFCLEVTNALFVNRRK